MFQDIRETERRHKQELADALGRKDARIRVVEALGQFQDTPGWRAFKEKLIEWKDREVKKLLMEQDPHQKFRVSGMVEAFTMLVAAVEDAASEAKRLAADREELARLSSGQLVGDDLRLNPAGGKWKDGEAHGSTRGRQGQGG